MQTIIHFIRHGKTKNPKHIVKGELPFKLTPQGEVEVAKLAKYLAENTNIAMIFYSPIFRTKQTAKILKKYLPSAKLIPDKKLYEWLTPWQGLTIKQIQKIPALQWLEYKKNPQKFYPLKKGEKADKVLKRMIKFVKQINKKNTGQQIIAVSHGDPIKLLRCFFETGKIDKKMHKYSCTQPSITSFVFNGNKYKKTIYKTFIKKQNKLMQ